MVLHLHIQTHAYIGLAAFRGFKASRNLLYFECDGVDGFVLREPMHQHVAFECVFRVEPNRMLNVSDACKRNGAPVVAIAREQHISNRLFLVDSLYSTP